MKPAYRIIVVALSALLLVACRTSPPPTDDDIAGRVLIWHALDVNEEAVLDQMLASFAELHPAVRLTDEQFAPEDLATTFAQQAESGLGPDIVILPAASINALAEDGLIREISAAFDEENTIINADQFLTSALDMVRDEDAIYGVPLSLSTFGLYYNKLLLGAPEESAEILATQVAAQRATITDTTVLATLDEILATVESAPATPPATNLETLMQQANDGQRVGLPSNFYDAFWGVQAFGGELIDEEGRVILNQGGFANWLGWLKLAQQNPNIILNRRSETLFDLFVNNNLTYYVASSETLPALQAAMGEEVVGMVRLPALQGRPAGPFLEVNALLFSAATAPSSEEAALRLAQFLTSPEQQTEFALSAGQLPVNNSVEVDPRIAPITAEFVAQSRTSVPIRLADRERIDALLPFGDTLYGQVLGGETTVVAAANVLTEQINEQYGFETLATATTDDCNVSGTVTLWHSYTDAAAQTLSRIRNAFQSACPNTLINLHAFERAELVDRYLNAVESGDTPDMLLITNRDLPQLAENELIIPLDSHLDAEFLQRYRLGLEATARFDGSLYGIPIVLNTQALFFDADLVQDPPIVLDDIMTMAADAFTFGIPVGFEASYWGIAAFGESADAPIFNPDGRLMLGEAGLIEWLAWLQLAQQQPNIMLSSSRETLREAFYNGELTFLIDDARRIGAISADAPTENLAVVPLPSGSPLLEVDLLALNPASDESAQTVALHFAQAMTDETYQGWLMEQASQVPVNINVDTANYPLIDGFVQQSESVVILPNAAQVDAMLSAGGLLYEEVLANEVAPTIAVTAFVNIVDATNGLEIVEADATPNPAECSAAGELALWHSWNDSQASAWEQLLTDFTSRCPDIAITTTFVPEAELAETLLAATQPDSERPPPDLFIGRHDDLQTYLNNGLLREITLFVDETERLAYLPRAMSSLMEGNSVYGLPERLDMQALFYRADSVELPAQSLNDLLAQVQAGQRIGFERSLEGLIWGGSTFGCEPCRTGEFSDSQGTALLETALLTDWVNYLDELAATGNALFTEDVAVLITQFVAGELDYLVVNSDWLSELHQTVGIADLGVAALPVGAEQATTVPYGVVRGFLFSAQATEAQLELALHFARFATSRESQVQLSLAADYVPTNNLAAVSADNPLVQPLIDQLVNVVPLPDQTVRQLLPAEINTLFESIGSDEE